MSLQLHSNTIDPADLDAGEAILDAGHTGTADTFVVLDVECSSLNGSVNQGLRLKVFRDGVAAAVGGLIYKEAAADTTLIFTSLPLRLEVGEVLTATLSSTSSSDTAVAVTTRVLDAAYSRANVQAWRGFDVVAPATAGVPTVDLAADQSAATISLVDDAITAAKLADSAVAKIEAALLNEGDGQQLIDALVQAIDDADISTELTAALIRNGILNRVLPGNHDTADTVGAFLQRLDAAMTSRSSHTAAEAGTDAAAKVLSTPANKLLTNASGHVLATKGDGSEIASQSSVDAIQAEALAVACTIAEVLDATGKVLRLAGATLSDEDDVYARRLFVITGGDAKHVQRRVLSYIGSTKTVTLSGPLAVVPAVDDTALLVGHVE